MAEVTVLVVDDDPVILKLLEVNFEMEGYTVITASDGQDGIDTARASRPDLIISDVMMPRKNGHQLVAELKGDAETKHIPIILLSAKAQASEIQKGLEMGADEYVTKPFDPLELIERVSAVLARH
jgi:DNA-binding response OmpR family regulator